MSENISDNNHQQDKLNYYQQIIEYCLTMTAELIKDGKVQEIEDDVFPCAESPATPQMGKEMEELRELFEDGTIELRFSK